MRLLFIDGSTRLESVRDLETRARGGMVTSLFKVSDYLAKEHDVTILSDIKRTGETKAGVKWVNEVDGSWDVLVCNRGIGNGYPEIQAKHRILWTHDLPHGGFVEDTDALKQFVTVFMSKYAERIWRAYYRDIDKSVMIPNGVDTDLFYPRDKDYGYLIYASAPNRGLQRLPFIYEAIKSRCDVYMKAFSRLSVLHPNEGHDNFDYDAVGYSGIEVIDPVPQDRFAEEIGRAGMMILPTDYPEICSNVVLQALASGTPVITTGKLGATCEWVNGKNGALTEFHPHDYMIYQMEIVRHAVRILEDRKTHEKLCQAQNRVPTWDFVGAKWNSLIGELQ